MCKRKYRGKKVSRGQHMGPEHFFYFFTSVYKNNQDCYIEKRLIIFQNSLGEDCLIPSYMCCRVHYTFKFLMSFSLVLASTLPSTANLGGLTSRGRLLSMVLENSTGLSLGLLLPGSQDNCLQS